MSTQTQDTTIAARLRALHADIAAGRIADVFADYYADDVRMQENTDAPCVGLAANLEREKAWLDGIAEWRSFELLSFAVNGDVSFAETEYAYRMKDGQEVHAVQTARAIWKDGKIVDERFYHA